MTARLIQSRDNALFRHVKRLLHDGSTATRAARRHAQTSLALEGIHLCQMWLQHVGQPEHALFEESALQHNAEIAALYARVATERRVLFNRALATELSQVAHGPGVYFVGHPPEPPLPEHIHAAAICLDRVQDPGNIGTLLRTAAAAGYRHAYLSRASASAWSNKALRAGQGAQFAMTIYADVDLHAVLARSTLPRLATALHDAASLYATPLPAQCVWIFGNEGQGVDPALLRLADLRINIPHSQAVESLNVAAAAAICLFEQQRQHRASATC